MSSSQETVVVSPPRELWVDNLRVLVVAGVIVAHTATGYVTDLADWHYDELTTSALWSTLLTFPVAAAAIFGLGPLFFLAGWFSPPSLAHRGAAGFARSRLLRLGVPLLAFVLLVQPLADAVGSLHEEDPRTYVEALGDTEIGVMWFVAAILVFSLVYAGWRRLRPAPDVSQPVRVGRLLVLAAAAVAVGSLLVWQVLPWNTWALFTARLGEWPQGAVLFALGLHARETGWFDELSRSTVRRLGWVAAIGVLATVGLFAVLDALGQAEGVLDEAAGWGTPVFALLDGVVAVSLTLWFVLWVRRRLPRHGPLVGKAARGSYATYVLHPLVLTSIMVLMAPVAGVPEVKFVLVSVVGVVICFAVGYGLTRVPGVSRVL